MTTHLVLGAGPAGRHVAAHLARQGADVILASRTGASPDLPGLHGAPDLRDVRRLRLDVTDPRALTAAAHGASVLYNCLSPAHYHRWPAQWPPLADALLTAAERTGAVLATVSNLYAYGPVDGPMTADLPDRPREAKGRVRAKMWADALRAHREGRVRAVEVRASDYAGAGVGAGGHLSRQLPSLRRGRTAWVLGDPDAPHTWTDVADVAATVVAAAAREDALGRVWLVPSPEPRSQREALTDLAALLGASVPTVRPMPKAALAAGALAVPMLRELRAIAYQFDAPFIVDASETSEKLRVSASRWEQVMARTAGTSPTP